MVDTPLKTFFDYLKSLYITVTSKSEQVSASKTVGR